jgi:hypothetical protein
MQPHIPLKKNFSFAQLIAWIFMSGIIPRSIKAFIIVVVTFK